MAIDKLDKFRNIVYDYKDQHDSFVARGLHLNEINDKLSMVIDEVNSGSITVGNPNEIPYSNATGDGFNYTNTFTFDGTDFTLGNLGIRGDSSNPWIEYAGTYAFRILMGSGSTNMVLATFANTGFSGPYSDITLGGTHVDMTLFNGSQSSDITISYSNMRVRDNINSKGLEYAANYDAVGVLDDDWIPSYRAVKAYADSVGGGSVNYGSQRGDIPTTNTTLDGFEYTTGLRMFGAQLSVFGSGSFFSGSDYANVAHNLYQIYYDTGYYFRNGRAGGYMGFVTNNRVGSDANSSLLLHADGSVSMALLGSDDTEDHLLAIDDTTGLITKRSVASLPTGGGVSFGTTTQIPYMNAGGTDFLYSSNLVFNGTLLTVTGNLYVSGATVNFTGLGSDDTEDHVVAIDDTTGLLTKRSVASMSTGGTVTSVGFTAGNLIDLSGTNPITSSGTITISVDLSELATSVTNGDGDYFVVVDSTNGQHKLTKSNINLSGFSNDAGWTSNAGTVTSVSGTGSVDGITLSGTVTGSGNLTLSGNINVGSVTGTLPVGNGGTGLTTVGANYILTGNGTAALTAESGLTYNGSTLAVTGAITATGEITAYSSDRRLKMDVNRIIDPLTKVKNLNGVIYAWDPLACSKVGFVPARTHEIGMIAQNLQSVIPDAVAPAPFDLDEYGNSISGEDYLTVRLEKVVPLLIEAIKELSEEVDRLKGK